jgi:outer membrane receptor protein involved in Fe transport
VRLPQIEVVGRDAPTQRIRPAVVIPLAVLLCVLSGLRDGFCDIVPSMKTYHPTTRARSWSALIGLSAAALAASGYAQPTTPATPREEQSTKEEEMIELSPFTVDASKDKGYYSENTLAGSRLNTRVADLGASITVVTKQQLVDTASLDMNDVFLYEANTEGANNYTDFNIDTRGAIQDRNAGFQGGAPSLPFGPSTSNRVRGIGSVDRLRDYYPSNQRIPFDVYNTESVEINRGPNSLLFGLGSAAGIVNQSSARANPRRQFFQVEARYGTNDAMRGSFNLNIPVVRDRFAIYAAALHDERGFSRRPSYDITQRYYGALTFKPFEKTVIRASYENYDNRNRRPNSTTPRDFISGWLKAGRPSYNPVTRMLTVNGVVTGPYDLSNANSIRALQTASGNTIQPWGNSRPVVMIDQGRELMFMQQHLSSTPNTAGTQAQFNYTGQPVRATRSLGPISQINVPPVGVAAGITFAEPGVSDKSIYDWERINIISGNHGRDKADIYNIELEQEILPNLHLQLGWYEEDFKSDVHYYISQQTGVTLYVDTDTVLLDGTPNPNFGRPYIEVTSPDFFQHPENNSTARANLAYEFDFGKFDNWTRWFGRHRVMGLWQENEIERYQLRYRPHISGNTQLWNPMPMAGNPPAPDFWSGNTTANVIERRFYVGDNQTRVTQDPGLYPNGSYSHTFRWFNPTTGQWVNEPVQEVTSLHFVSSHSKQKIESQAIALQSFLFNERLITTFGWRKDKSVARTAGTGARLPNGFTNPANLNNFDPPQRVSGNTKSYGGVLRPFKGWSFIERPASDGSVVYDAVRSFGVHYNKSDNFAPAGINTDFYNRFLPFPSGEGKDYGVSFSLFNEKLVARLNWFEASQNNARGAVVAQPLTRTQTMDDVIFRAWAQLATGSSANNSPAVNAILKLPEYHAAQAPGQFFNVPVAATSTVEAEGLEFQLTYNPTTNWTIKVSGGKQETIYTKIAPEYDVWIAERMPIWTAATAAGMPRFWDATGADLPNQNTLPATQRVQDWFFTNIDAIMRTAKRTEGKTAPDQRRWRWNLITNYIFDQGAMRGFGVGGAVRWEDKAAIGYYGAAPDPDGIIRSLDVNRPIYDEAETHLDVWLSYTFRSTPWLGDKVRTKLQLNVRDALESGRLAPIAANPDGTASAYRIVEPRQWYLTATFDF